MFCQNCGYFDTNDARFCSRCGESLAEAAGKEGPSHLHSRGGRALHGKTGFFKGLRDFQPPSLGRMRFLYKLFIPVVALFALLSFVTGFQTSQGFGLIVLLLIVAFAFLFTLTCDRITLELGATRPGAESRQASAAPKVESNDQIEWNIE